ncbi:MAG: BatA domain-containing protein [Planctomycetaceae bacterium]|nr:BatA domain-containing protein [Planctomycetaceae bacterium]
MTHCGLLAFHFVQPALLWGLLLVALPIIVQFFRRSRPHVEAWGAMQLLRVAVQRVQRRVWLDRWLHLLMRIIAIALIVLALSQPRSDVTAEGVGQNSIEAVQWILVLDSSLSMGAEKDGESCFDVAQEHIIQLLRSARAGDTFRLIRNVSHLDRILVSEATSDVDSLLLELEFMSPTQDRGDWLTTLRDVNVLLANESRERVRVVLLTDMQDSEWSRSPADQAAIRSEFERISQIADVQIVDASVISQNLAITKVMPDPAWLIGATQGTVRVRVANYGNAAADVDVDILLDEEHQRSQRLHLNAREETEVTLPVEVLEPGDHVVHARISDDAVKADNHGWCILPDIAALRVLIIDEEMPGARKQPHEYLQMALAGESLPSVTGGLSGKEYDVTIAQPDQAVAIRLFQFDAVVLNNVAELQPAFSEQLIQFVQNGGGLIISVGDQWAQATPPTLAQMFEFQVADDVMSLEESSTPFSFEIADESHPMMSVFVNHPEAGLISTRIYRYLRVDPGAGWTHVVNYSSGDPAILTRKMGHGRVVLVSSAISDSWGSWVLWPSFVPMVRESLNYANEGRFAREDLVLGDEWSRAIPQTLQEENTPPAFASPPTIGLPDQRTSFSERSTDGTHWTFANTLQPGAYTVSQQDKVERFVVNVDIAESDLKRTTLKELKQTALKGVPIQDRFADNSVVSERSAGNSSFLWSEYLLLLAVGAWCVDLALSKSRKLAAALTASLITTTTLWLIWPLATYQIVSSFLLLTAALWILFRLGTRMLRRREMAWKP